jgi:hypothetical protein
VKDKTEGDGKEGTAAAITEVGTAERMCALWGVMKDAIITSRIKQKIHTQKHCKKELTMCGGCEGSTIGRGWEGLCAR